MRFNVILFVVSYCALGINGQQYYYPVVPPSLHCLKKTCEQIVTGRHMPYAKVLGIIHHSDYLNAIYITKIHPNNPTAPSPLTATTHTSIARQREKRQTPTIDATNIQGMTPPLLVGIPLFILSAMFIASMRRNREKPEVVEEVAEIIVDTPPTFTTLTPPYHR